MKKNDIKGTWAILSNAISKSYVKCIQVKSLEIGDDVVSSNQLICNEINTFFSGIDPSLAEKIHCNDLPTVLSFLKNKNKASLFVKYVYEEELISTVLSCKTKSSLDSDNISMFLIQQTIHCITEPLLYIFNLSFNMGHFPSKMKIAKVIPIFKKGNKLDPSNYRPISLS